MIFSELYSVYYNTVAAILNRALESEVTEEDLWQQVLASAFSESVLTILPHLKSGKWQLLHEDFTTVIYESPTMPLTTLEKRWLKSIADDKRLRLFDIELPELEDVMPLFCQEDYKIFDQYLDGDSYEDETYIQNFRIIRLAIKEERAVKITMVNRRGNNIWVRFFPKGFEYSMKDDKIRVVAAGCRYKYFNLGRIQSCVFCGEDEIRKERSQEVIEERKKEVTLEITDYRNALERVMLHFVHFEKQAERIDEQHYRLRLCYYESDETELVIRILSFGPLVKVVEPESFVELMKHRLMLQKSCGLK